MRHSEEAGRIWNDQVPPSGQSSTVEGEMLRDVEKCRWEAQNNGNRNWDFGFELMLSYLEQTLLDPDTFDAAAFEEIRQDLARLRDFEHPETSDEPYDRLGDRVVEWSQAHNGPVPREHDPNLKR